MRGHARTDANQQAIVNALRKAGAFVQPLYMVGKGCPDLLVSYRQRWLVMECKDENQPPSKQRLTPDEVAWIAAAKAPTYVVKSPAEAVGLLAMATR